MEAPEAATLRSLLLRQPVATLATLHKGKPAVSLVPFAMLPSGAGFVIHVSKLATHTNDMLESPAVALLVAASLGETETPLALPRASIQGRARRCLPESSEFSEARTAYLAKLPEAEELFTFSDFSVFIIEPESVRFVAGFGRAMSLTAERMRAVLGPES